MRLPPERGLESEAWALTLEDLKDAASKPLRLSIANMTSICRPDVATNNSAKRKLLDCFKLIGAFSIVQEKTPTSSKACPMRTPTPNIQH